MIPTASLRVHKKLLYLATGALVIMASVVFAGGSLFLVSDGTPAAIRWDDRMLPVNFVLSEQGYAGSGITNAELALELGAAIDQYNAIPESRIALVYAGETDLNNSGSESILGAGIDGVNLVTFNDPDLSFGPGVAAVCAQTVLAAELTVDDSNNDLNGDGVADLTNGVYPPGTILDADIVFNDNIALEVSGVDGTADVQSVALHEIGHCIGLSHSAVRDAVMFPFLSSDIASTRTLKEDDIAFVGDTYPLQPNFDNAYGAIEGQVLSGITGKPVVGAHVFAEDAVSRTVAVGAFTGLDGRYRIPLPAGDFVVGIEPLDGVPAGLDPTRINTLIQSTTDVFFPEEYFDTAESSTDDPDAIVIVPVTAGVASNGVDLVTNTIDVVSSSLLISRGVNLISYPVSVPGGVTAFDLLSELSQSAAVNSIQRLNSANGQFETAHLVDGIPSGYDFPISRSDGYIIHGAANDLLRFTGAPDCPAFDLVSGSNLIAAPCAPAGYSAYDLLQDLGNELDVISVQSYDQEFGDWVLAEYAGPDPTGVDFSVVDGGAYLVDLAAPVSNFKINADNSGFSPLLLSVSPGAAIPGGIVTAKGTGFSVDTLQNVVLFNGLAGEILTSTTQQIVVRVPLTAVSGTVQILSAGLASNALPFVVLSPTLNEIEGQVNDLAPGQVVSGSLSDENDIDDYRFLAIEGNRITVRVTTAVPGVPELRVNLLNPLGGTLTASTNGTGFTAIIRNYPAPETGFYTINIQSLSGSGPYTLELFLEGSPGEPRLVAIQGDYQTGVMGTELPTPLQIVAIDETGLSASGVPISFAVVKVGQQGSATMSATVQAGDPTRAMTSGDMSTLSSGILTTSVQLPDDETGDFEIIVTAPFRTSQPITLLVSAIPKPINTVEMTPASQYACVDGTGCEVGQEVDIPYELIFKDIDGDPIENVYVEFAAVSGDGQVSTTSGGPWSDKVRIETGTDGAVEVYHQLGEQMFITEMFGTNDPNNSRFDPFQKRLPIAQMVAATVPGQALPATFEAVAKASAPAIIRPLRSQNQRASMGAATLGLFTFLVTDQFGNPVVGAPVSTSANPPGVFNAPGFLRGQIFASNVTDQDGFWSLGLGVADDGSLLTPTINEFREVVELPIAKVFIVGSASTLFLIDIDMGPYVLTETIGAHALIGKLIPDTLTIQVRRFQRLDEYIDNGGVDEDDGFWEDETYENVREIIFNDLPITTTIRRLDDLTTAMKNIGIPTTTIGGAEVHMDVTANFGRLTYPDVRVGGVFGGINLITNIGTQDIEYYRDGEFTPYRTEQFEFVRGVVPVRADPLILQVDLEDFPATDPMAPRKYPGLGLASGINIDQIGVSVNGDDMFPIGLLGQPAFPNFVSLTYDGKSVGQFEGHLGENLRPEKVQLTFYPSSDQLIVGDMNEIVIQQFQDDLDHRGVAADPAADTDQSANTITFEFSF